MLFITAVCVIFLFCIAFSTFGYRMRLTEMQTQFPDDLETSVDRCTERANVILRMKNGRQYTLEHFQNGLTHNVYEIRENYAVFSELMHKYCKNFTQTRE